jgi:hypothetical protein
MTIFYCLTALGVFTTTLRILKLLFPALMLSNMHLTDDTKRYSKLDSYSLVNMYSLLRQRASISVGYLNAIRILMPNLFS